MSNIIFKQQNIKVVSLKCDIENCTLTPQQFFKTREGGYTTKATFPHIFEAKRKRFIYVLY